MMYQLSQMTPLSETPRLELAKSIARTVHANQPYGKCAEGRKRSYEDGHLIPIIGILADAGMNSEEDEIIGWLHDSIEDVLAALRLWLHDMIREQFSDHVYQSVWAVTGLGANRAERTISLHTKLVNYEPAANYKVADRIRNMENSKLDREIAPKAKRMFALYMSEDRDFREHVLCFATNQALIDRYNAVATYD